MMPLAVNQQRMEETLAYQKKKELRRKDVDDYDLARLKGWLHKEDVNDLQVFWRNVVASDGWEKDETYLLKTMKMWSKSPDHAIDPSFSKGQKHMESITSVDMTVKLGRTFEDIREGHSMLAFVQEHIRGKAKQGKGQYKGGVKSHTNA